MQVGQFLFQIGQTVLGCSIVFQLQRLNLDLHLQDVAVQLVQFFGLAVHFHPQPAGRFVHKVNRLIRQETVRDIAVRQRCRRHKGRVADPYPVVQFVLFLDPAQDADRVFDRGFLDHDRLEPTGQRRVFFNILAVFIQRGRTDTVQFPPRQRRFDQVRGIHRTIGFTRAHQRVHLINKQDDFARSGLDLFQNGFQPLLELAPIFRASNQRAHVQRQQFFIAQGFRHITVDNAQGHALGNRGFTHAGFPDQNRVVLGPAA